MSDSSSSDGEFEDAARRQRRRRKRRRIKKAHQAAADIHFMLMVMMVFSAHSAALLSLLYVQVWLLLQLPDPRVPTTIPPGPRFIVGLGPFPSGRDSDLRFKAADFYRITRICGLPNPIRTKRGNTIDTPTALALVCYLLSYPTKLSTAVQFFKRGESTLCQLFLETCKVLDVQCGHLLLFNTNFIRASMPAYAAAIHAKGCPLANCIGFTDCTARRTCKPRPKASRHPGVTSYALQRAFYTGYTKVHGFKYLTTTFPNGLIVGAAPVALRHADATALNFSGWGVQAPFLDNMGNSYTFYGDAAFPMLGWMCKPWPNAQPGSPEHTFNTGMNQGRVTAEWGYNIVSNSWQGVDFARWQRIFWTRPGCRYRVAQLLTNFRTCIEQKSQIGDYFDLLPPPLEDYVNGYW